MPTINKETLPQPLPREGRRMLQQLTTISNNNNIIIINLNGPSTPLPWEGQGGGSKQYYYDLES